jgi:hypothetical protein
MDSCNKLITHGMIIRLVTTIIVCYIINVKIIYNHNQLYLILPILLCLLDEVDNIYTKYYKNNSCTKLFYYQYTDKLCDTISYLLFFLFFKLDNNILFFILYRLIGVILFRYTKDSKWLIIFFDFAKEYLIYKYIYNTNYIYIPICVILKICFEYYYHTIHNPNNYN